MDYKLYVISAVAIINLFVIVPLVIFGNYNSKNDNSQYNSSSTASSTWYSFETTRNSVSESLETMTTELTLPVSKSVEESSTINSTTHQNASSTELSSLSAKETFEHSTNRMPSELPKAITTEKSLSSSISSEETSAKIDKTTSTVQAPEETIPRHSEITTYDSFINITETTMKSSPSTAKITASTTEESIPTTKEEPTSTMSTTTTIPTSTTTKRNKIPLSVELLLREEWCQDYPEFICTVPLASRIKTVLIQQTLKDNCYSRDECMKTFKALMKKDKYGQLLDINYNFIIGGDGVVYEARGWECRTDNITRFYTPQIDELHLGLAGDARKLTINDNQLDVMKRFLFDASQQGPLKKFWDDWILMSYHDTRNTCSCPIDQSAISESCSGCVLKRAFPV